MAEPPRRSLFGSPVVEPCRVDDPDPPGLTFQALDRMKAERSRLESRRVALVDKLWHAAASGGGVLSYDEYVQLYLSVSKYCTGDTSAATLDEDWPLDTASDDAESINHGHFHQLIKQLVELWGPVLQASSDGLLNSIVQELVDPGTGQLRDCDRVNPHEVATAVQDVLEGISSNGSWGASNETLVRALHLDSHASRYDTTAAALGFLDRVAATDSRWTALRTRTTHWLAQHEGDKHFAELEALLHRLHVSFDVAPLMRQRLDPLLHTVRTAVLDALVAMDEASLVPCLEWLRTLTPPMWRVLASPIGAHPSLTDPSQIQAYLTKLGRFTLTPELCAFCDSRSIVEKQELLVFLHTLSPLQLGHFRETLQRPTHKFATSAGVKVAVAFFTNLPAMQRIILKNELHAFVRDAGDSTARSPPHKDSTSSLLSTVPPPPRSRLRRRQKSPKPHQRRPLEPILRPSMSAPSMSPDSGGARPMLTFKSQWATPSEAVALWNGDVYSPPKSAMAWSRSPLSPAKQQFEAKYFDAPSISRHRLEFCPPDHVKHLSLPKVTERHVCDMSLDPTWVSPVDLTNIGGAAPPIRLSP